MVRSYIFKDIFSAVAVCFLLSGCGTPARKKTSGTVDIPVTTNPPTVIAPLSCTAAPSASVLNVFGDAAGNLLPNVPASTVQIAVSASRAGAPVVSQVVRIQASSGDFRVEGDPSPTGTGTQIVMRPFKKGIHSATISVAAPDNIAEVATCTFQVELRVTSPPDLRVMIAANGAGPAITLSEGQAATINWAAVNATACVLSRDGVALPTQPAAGVLNGEFAVGPFNNPGIAPLSTVFGIECQGPAGAGLVQRASVGITVNPVPRAVVEIVGAGASKTIRFGEYVDIAWTSAYATSGCLLSNGITGDLVPPSGQIRVENITASVRFTVYCRDNYRGIANSSANVTALNPRVTITANGLRNSFTQGIRESFTISWAAADVTSCAIQPFNDTRVAGSVLVSAFGFDRNASYQVTCQSYFGPVSDAVNVVYLGDWYQTAKTDFGNQRDCSSFCGGFGKTNVNSPDGSRCASGELIPPSALGKINFSKGCGDYSCNIAHGAPNGLSEGFALNAYCWGSGQKTNKNNGDEVMGCFCR